MVGKVTTIKKMSASRLPALMGYSPWSSPNDELDISMRGRKEDCDHYESQVGEAADWGNDFEDMILTRAAERLGLSELKLNYPTPYMYEDILQASLDGGAVANNLTIETDESANIFVMNDKGRITLDGPGVLEAKLTRAPASQSPAMYRGPIQLQGQMLCTGAKWGVIATLYQGVELYLYVYDVDKMWQNAIVMACRDFERRIEEEDWYPAMSAAEAAAMNDEVKPEKVIDADADMERMMSDMAQFRDQAKAYKQLAEDMQLAIMNKMGDATKVVSYNYQVTWPMRRVKAKPAQMKEIPAVEEHFVRAKTLKIEGMDNE